MSSILRTLTIAQNWVRDFVSPGETVLDATVGNGHDLRFLADLVGPEGSVYGFDRQAEALDSARSALVQEGVSLGNITLIEDCHSRLSSHTTEPLRAAMFNLGYLPAGNREIVTTPETTIQALEQTLALLEPVGIITVVCYRGHPSGKAESEAILEWSKTLPIENHFAVLATTLNSRAESPFLLGIEKR